MAEEASGLAFDLARQMTNAGTRTGIGAGQTGNTLTVLTNNGNSGFGFNATLTVGLGPYDKANSSK